MIVTAVGRSWIENEAMYKSIKQTTMRHILISIADDEKRKVDLKNVHNNPYCKGIITQYFEDIEKPEEGYILFSENHAEGILEITNTFVNVVDVLLIHCTAGVSRSVGVAAALSKLLNRTDDKYFKGCPNFHVYTTLLKYYSDNKEKYPNINKYYYEKNPITDSEIF
jgi:predicted protein tyrosine phosphatase